MGGWARPSTRCASPAPPWRPRAATRFCRATLRAGACAAPRTWGGGHQTFFKLEQGFNFDTDTLASPTQAFNRETVVGLRHATLGSQFTPNIAMSLRIDSFQRSGMGAMLTLLQRGSAAARQHGGRAGLPGSAQQRIPYISPSVGGFVGRVMYAPNEGASPFGHPASSALEYARGALSIGAATTA